MSNNIVLLMGWLEVEAVEDGLLDGNPTPQPVVHAWIYTHKPSHGGKHPLVIRGTPAEITLEWAKKCDSQAGPPQVVVKGQLASYQGITLVEVKVIHFLSTFAPEVQKLVIEIAGILNQKEDNQLRPALLELLRQSNELGELFDWAMERAKR